MQPPPLEDEQINQFHRDGYLIVKDCIAPDDIARIRHIAERDAQLQADAHYNHNHEGDGLGTRLVYRNQLADDVYGAYVRSQRLVTPMQQLFGDKMRHYYHLQMLKDPQTGGWQWHQDYGCLRVLRGSHRLGRLEHQQSGSQLIANPERVEWALKEMEEVYCELEPGSLLYFHGNVLHASHSNESTQPRWSLVCAYVTAANTCVLPDVEAILSAPLEAWDDAQVNEATERHEQMVAASRSA